VAETNQTPREPGDEAPVERRGPERRGWPLRLVVSLVVAAGLLVLVIWLADLDEVWRRARSADPWAVALSFAAYCVTYLARARRFAALGARASTPTLFSVVAIHAAMNRLMPLKTGELAYPLLASRVGAATMGEGLVQLVVTRLLDMVTVPILFLGAVVLGLASGSADLGSNTWILVAAAAAIVAIALAALWKMSWLLGLALRIMKRLFSGSGGMRGRAQRLLERAEGAVAAVTDLSGRQRFSLGLWSLACWGSYFVTFHFIMVALGVRLSFLRSVLGSSAAIVGSTIPISGLGTFGSLEGGWTAGFVALGVAPSTAASTALVMSGLTLLFSLALAGPGWIAISVSSRAATRADATRSG
jgi:uncharacterized protein (TIRG00374 family)